MRNNATSTSTLYLTQQLCYLLNKRSAKYFYFLMAKITGKLKQNIILNTDVEIFDFEGEKIRFLYTAL